MIDQMRGGLDHAPGVARRADGPALVLDKVCETVPGEGYPFRWLGATPVSERFFNLIANIA